ncbi:hypothetical protein L228DRAFT_238856 [Xylona heveae TC161]|uniref:Hemerythrin-like domain-containing protein n=1 Tax=Xylona heveae (strain CBS 132557 / TC161) TaxID=1328760 RepID=A0A165H4A5_XYLHT|nr:hypothetical protein L228DRAFT_238856 [Xylona heveae TC161]KZF22966.1 hypothetical protein L228DRAFT_238856 [Xylona heveae TC161]
MSTISDAIKQDHREIEEYYDKIVNSSDQDTQTRYQNLFTWELARHSIGEELVIYPALEKYLGDKGKQLADRDRQEHQTVKEALYKFQGLKANDPDFIPTLKSLMSDLSEHIKEEERDDLPGLENALASSQDQMSEDLVKSFERTKLLVPTRSHPSAPDKPPFETVVGLMTAPIDHVMDIFRKFPQ